MSIKLAPGATPRQRCGDVFNLLDDAMPTGAFRSVAAPGLVPTDIFIEDARFPFDLQSSSAEIGKEAVMLVIFEWAESKLPPSFRSPSGQRAASRFGQNFCS